MELIAIAPRNLLNKEEWSEIKKRYTSIRFVNKNEISSFDYNKTKCDKVLLLDPDYFDWNFPNEILSIIENLKCVCLTTTTASYVDEEYLKANRINCLQSQNIQQTVLPSIWFS